MNNVDITQKTYGQRIEKSPPFAKDIVVVFADDISVETMRLFSEAKAENWMNPMLKEMILDWNLCDAENNKLPISIEGLDKIKSVKLRNWIIATLQEIILDRLTSVKKK